MHLVIGDSTGLILTHKTQHLHVPEVTFPSFHRHRFLARARLSPALVSCVSPGPAGPSPSWWGKGCPGVCTANVWAVGPCPAAPVSCGELWPHPDETWRNQKLPNRFTKTTYNPLQNFYTWDSTMLNYFYFYYVTSMSKELFSYVCKGRTKTTF